MSEIKTGGPAFPTENKVQIGSGTWRNEGITLLDYFAAKAMQGMLADGFSASSEDLAKFSYGVAREMILERGK